VRLTTLVLDEKGMLAKITGKIAELGATSLAWAPSWERILPMLC